MLQLSSEWGHPANSYNAGLHHKTSPSPSLPPPPHSPSSWSCSCLSFLSVLSSFFLNLYGDKREYNYSINTLFLFCKFSFLIYAQIPTMNLANAKQNWISNSQTLCIKTWKSNKLSTERCMKLVHFLCLTNFHLTTNRKRKGRHVHHITRQGKPQEEKQDGQSNFSPNWPKNHTLWPWMQAKIALQLTHTQK